MDDATDPPAAQHVDVMDVSPALRTHPADDKENEADTDAPPLPTPAVPAPPDNRETDFAYVLRSYTTIPDSKVYSPWHYFGAFRWRLLIFPKGNQASNHDLSVYLECGGPATPERIITSGKEPAHVQWSRPAKFSLHVVHPSSPIAKAAIRGDSANTQPSLADLDVSATNLVDSHPVHRDIVKETVHLFRESAGDWGFLEFAPFASLQPGQYADDDMNVVIMVRILLQDNFPDQMYSNTATWDSRKHTGFVGFKNQGATCYMNSLLQTLYMLSAFRKAVYNMPLPDPQDDTSPPELSYALQKVFYELQFSQTVVKTKKLTESFGWDTTDAFTQHDIQELKLILCDELAEKMKKVAPNAPNVFSSLFQGKLLNYIECVDVDYQSTREEDFSDISLDVKGCRNIYDSLEKYIEVEILSGDNKYKADGFDELQEARKGVKFLKFPPVLHIHLKRFDFDYARLAMVKINDRYEFDLEMDLNRFVEDTDGNDVYVLHSVLVHIGDVNGGHYHAYIRPEIETGDGGPKKPSQWFKFDDENVSLASEEAAIQENFGFGGEMELQKRGQGMDDDLNGINGQTAPPSTFQTRTRNFQNRRSSNAYMLQYMRKSDVPYLLEAQSDLDVPVELKAQIKKERENDDRIRRNKLEQHLYMTIAVATDDNMAQHHGADLVDWEKVRQLRVKRALQLVELKALLQNEGIIADPKRMRLWKCSGRDNETIRPDALVADGVDSQPITDANGRIPLTQTGYSLPLHYSGRHVYSGQEDIVRMYAEDLVSEYCLEPGQAFRDYLEVERSGNGVKGGKLKEEEEQLQGNMDLDGALLSEFMSPSFPLRIGEEVLLFLKYYTPNSSHRLHWLGHFVVDRAMKVKELRPLMMKALKRFEKELGPAALKNGLDMAIFEEVSSVEISRLILDCSLESQRIPVENGGGDIMVFQQAPSASYRFANGEKDAYVAWDGMQEISRGDGTDLPLGGRPLPTVGSYFDYLNHKVKIVFRDKNSIGTPDEGKSIFFELLRRDTYRTARKVLSGALGVDADPDYIRLFSHDLNRDAPLEPLRIHDNDALERVLPIHNLMGTAPTEYRTLWFERTEYHISEFDRKDEVRVVWRQDGGARAMAFAAGKDTLTSANGRVAETGGKGVTSEDATMDGVGESEATISSSDNDEREFSEKSSGHALVGGTRDALCKSFSVLVPMMSTYADVMEQVRLKLEIRASVPIRMFEVKNSKIFKFISPNESVPAIMIGSHDCGAELRAEPVPPDETEESLGEDYDLLMVVHLAKEKQPRIWRGLSFFGVPFVVKVKKCGESVGMIRKRIQEKLGIPVEEFEDWPLAEIKQLKVVYLDELDMMYIPHDPTSVEFCSLAIEHKSTAPAKRNTSAMSRFADKPLKIRS